MDNEIRNKLLEDAISEMSMVLLKYIDKKEMEYAYKFGSTVLSSVVATFIYNVFKGDSIENKTKFMINFTKAIEVILSHDSMQDDIH